MLIDIRQILLGKLISNCSAGGGILLKEILVSKWELRMLCSLSSAQQNQVELNRDLMVLLVYCALTGAPLNICHFKKESCQSILIRRSPWEMNVSLWLKGSKNIQHKWLLSELHIFPSLQVIICSNIYYNYMLSVS